MTKPLQQTIGGTVYTVGQVLKNYTEAAPLLDYIALHKCSIEWAQSVNGGMLEAMQTKFKGPVFQPSVMPIKIIALPNPDLEPGDEWVKIIILPEYGDYEKQNDGEAAFTRERYGLEYIITHASEVKIEWPEWGRSPFTGRYTPQDIFFALQIGAKVSIKRKDGV